MVLYIYPVRGVGLLTVFVAMKSCCLLPCLAVVALVCSIKAVTGQSHSVNVQLQYSSLSSSGCIGGNEDGLTNTSVLLQYRVAVLDGSVAASAPTLGEWIDLAARNATPSANVMQFLTLDSSVQGLQLRLLQLEHGGGSCNCWYLDSMAVTLDNSADVQLSAIDDTCFTTGSGSFCDGGAGEARGLITRVLYFPGSNGTMCGSDDDTLISRQGPSLPPNCSTETPRL